MDDLFLKWIAKAERDLHTAQYLGQLNDSRLLDTICFYYQQCAEKYVKAFLLSCGKSVESHDTYMKDLYVEALTVAPEFETYKADFDQLDGFGIDILYPGRSASFADIQPNAQAVKHLRAFIRQKLGLDQPGTPQQGN